MLRLEEYLEEVESTSYKSGQPQISGAADCHGTTASSTCPSPLRISAKINERSDYFLFRVSRLPNLVSRAAGKSSGPCKRSVLASPNP